MTDTRPRVAAWNIATLDGRIAMSASLPAWLDERWMPVERAFDSADPAATTCISPRRTSVASQ